MKHLKTLLISVILSALIVGTMTAKWYGNIFITANSGIVWDDLGGIELYGDPGMFLCPSAISPLPMLPNNLPSFTVDC